MTTTSSEVQLAYLSKDNWSPRFEASFYSVKIEGRRLFTGRRSTAPEPAPEEDSALLPAAAIPPGLGGKTSLPAYYYQVVVYRAHERIRLWRRYSHFHWLYHQVTRQHPVPSQATMSGGNHHTAAAATAPGPMPPLVMPPGTCPWKPLNEAGAQARQEQLDDFLCDLLSRPGYANHAAVKLFLELS